MAKRLFHCAVCERRYPASHLTRASFKKKTGDKFRVCQGCLEEAPEDVVILGAKEIKENAR